MSGVNFAAWYNERLREKGMSAGEFAQHARISRAASYFYRDGSRVPTGETLYKIAAAFGVERSTLPTFSPK